MSIHQATKYGEFFTQFGGMIAVICFFIPWRGILSAYRYVVVSPFNSTDFLIIIAFIASVMIFSISYYTLERKESWKSRIPIFMSSGIGLGVLLEFQFPYILKIENGLSVSHLSAPLFNGLGFWGTVSGFAIAGVGGFLIRAEEANRQSKVSVDEKQLASIVFAGGMIALLSFFMPSEKIGDFDRYGFKLMRWRLYLVIVFKASLIIMVGSFYTWIGKTWKLRVPVLISIGIGLGLLFSFYICFYLDEMRRADFSRELNLEPIQRSIRFGSWGPGIGFIVAAIGMLLSERKNRGKQVDTSTEVSGLKTA